ncbi:Leucine-rich repeat-containing protein 9 [Sparganum proliferum]
MLTLSNFPLLRKLNLNDSEYNTNPLSSLYLAPLVVFHQIPKLEMFDGLDAGCASLIAFLDSVIANKKLYYFHANRCQVNKLIHIESNLRDVRRALLTPVTGSIRNLDNELRSLKAASDFLSSSPEFDRESFDKKVELLKSRIHSWKRQMTTINLEFSQYISELRAHRLLRRCLLACELQMVGGLTFVEGCQSDPWFKMCEKFCLSRFCLHDPSFRHFSGLRLKSIYRVCNTVLLEHTGFTQLSEDECDSEDDLLFYCGDFSSALSLCKLATFVRSGFSASDDSSKIILTTLLNSAITNCSEGSIENDFGAGSDVRFFRGLIVRCRSDSFWPESSTEVFISDGVPSAEVNLSAKGPSCACRQSHSKYELDKFIRRTHSLFHFAGDLAASTPALSFEDIDKFFENELSNDRSVLQLLPERPTPPSLANMTLDDALEHSWFAKSLPRSRFDITQINFHGTRVPFLAQLSSLQSLSSLVLSNCGLSSLDAVSGLNLRHLDVSHNKISSLADMKDLPSLLTLDINWNKFSVLEKELKHISKHVKSLVTLNLEFNPWTRDSSLHSRVQSLLPKLKFVDETPLKTVARAPGLSSDTFRSTELFSDSIDYSLTLWPVNFFPSRYRNYSDCLPTKASNELTTVENLDGLVELRDLVLDDNRIRRFSEASFSSNWNLQELHIEGNRLKELHHINHLCKLQRFFLSRNKLDSLENLDMVFTHLGSLKQVNMLDNPVTKKNMHRIILCVRLPSIECIDGTPVTELEKQIATEVCTESGLFLGPDAQTVSCPDISVVNSSRKLANSRAPTSDATQVKCQFVKVDFCQKGPNKPGDSPQSKPNSVRDRGDAVSEHTEIRHSQTSRVSKRGAVFSEHTCKSYFHQDVSLVFDLFSRLSNSRQNPAVDSNTSNEQSGRSGTVPGASTQANSLAGTAKHEISKPSLRTTTTRAIMPLPGISISAPGDLVANAHNSPQDSFGRSVGRAVPPHLR